MIPCSKSARGRHFSGERLFLGDKELRDRYAQCTRQLLQGADTGRCLPILDQAQGVDVQPAHFGQRADGQSRARP